MGNIFEWVRSRRHDYTYRTITVADGYEFSQYKLINIINLYSLSQYENGGYDEIGQEMPFHNILNYRSNTQTRLEDIDTKDHELRADKPRARAQTMLMRSENEEWMREAKWAQTLNEMTQTRGMYGGLLVKKMMVDGVLTPYVVSWRNTITDPIDIPNGVVIEHHRMLPSEVLSMTAWKDKERAVQLATTNVKSEDLNENSKQEEAASYYVDVYEINGVIPESIWKQNGDPLKFERRKIIVSGVDMTAKDAQGQKLERGVIHFNEVQDASPFKYLAYRKAPSRSLGVGVFEEGLQAQIWTNFTVYSLQNILNITGKVMIQSPDPEIDVNILTDVPNGQVFSHEPGMPMSRLELTPTSSQLLVDYMNIWDQQAERATSTFGAVIGESQPSGTPFRLGALVNEEARSMFDYRKEEMGIFIQDIYDDWVLPHLKSRILKKDDLYREFTPEQIQAIDEAIITQEVKKMLDQAEANGTIDLIAREDMEATVDALRQQLAQDGTQRMIEGVKELMKGDPTKYGMTVHITNENENKATKMETLSNLFAIYAQNAETINNDPKAQELMSEIMETANLSSMPLMGTKVQTQQANQPQTASSVAGLTT